MEDKEIKENNKEMENNNTMENSEKIDNNKNIEKNTVKAEDKDTFKDINSNEIKTFNDFNISDGLKKAIEDMEFIEPTEIQKEVIPLMLDNKDIIAQAPTGTGKTCAFLIPIVNNVDKDSESVQVIIMCPTRELVLQTTEELKNVTKYTEKVRIQSIYGGQNIERQLFGLRKRPQIIIGTPGRVIDHLERKTLKLNDLKVLVLDEADEMLDMGFREDIDKILQKANKERQTVLFSATMPKEIIEISKSYQKEPVMVKTKLKENEIPDIEQYYTVVSEKEKIKALTTLLDDKKFNLALIFCNTKKRAQELALILMDYGYKAEALHGDLRQSQRDNIMKRFRSNEIKILIATDVAARGIDVDDIEAIFNYDIPYDTEYYVHRIGRTARANKKGIAYSFVTSGQINFIKDYEKFTKISITKLDVLKGKNDMKIDDKKLKIAFSNLDSNLNEFKDYIKEKLDEFNTEKETDFDYLDLIAAVMKTDNEMPTLSEAGLRNPKERKQRSVRNNPDATRLFINVGTRDKATEQSLKQFISSSASIDENDICDVKLLENFGFIEVKNDKVQTVMGLIGQKLNSREINIEVAGDRPAKIDSKGGRRSGERRDSRPRERSFRDRRDFKKDFGDKKREFKKDFSADNASDDNGDNLNFLKQDKEFKSFERDYKEDNRGYKGGRSYSDNRGRSDERKFESRDNFGRKGFDRKKKFEDGGFSGRSRNYEGKGRRAMTDAEFSAETFDYKKDNREKKEYRNDRSYRAKSVSEGSRAPKRKEKTEE